MRNKAELLVAVLGFFGGWLWAGVAGPDPVEIVQPDGRSFWAVIKGDEHRGWMETLAGYTLIKNQQNGFWEYAVKGKNGVLLSSNVAVVTGGEAGLVQDRHLKPPRRELPRPWAHENIRKRTRWEPSPISGQRNLLIVLVNFSDRFFETETQDWAAQTFDERDGAVSVARFYRENSFGALTLRAVPHVQGGSPPGVIRVSLARKHPNYGNGSTFESTVAFSDAEAAWINDALLQAGRFVNFPAWDLNRDNFLSREEISIYFVLAGFDASRSAREPNIWAHAWRPRQAGQVIAGGKNLAGWAVEGELVDDGIMLPLGVMAHELGHALCVLPDLYDVDGNNAGFGVFGIMGLGSNGRLNLADPSGSAPAAMAAWSRYYLGWSQPRVPIPGQVLEFPPALSRRDAPVLLRNDQLSTSEFFLVENRTPTSWDLGMAPFLEQPVAQLRQEQTPYSASVLTYSPPGVINGLAIPCGFGHPGDFPLQVAGELALISRGELTFRDKVLNAKAAGAAAAIIFNNSEGGFRGTLSEPGDYVPVIGISDSDGPLLANRKVSLNLVKPRWESGLLIIHVDENAGPRINSSDDNEFQGITVVEANDTAGSLLENNTNGHLFHLFFQGNRAEFADFTSPGSKLHDGRATGLGLSRISEPGELMRATFTLGAEAPGQLENYSYVIPWIVDNAQWNSRLAILNQSTQAAAVRLLAVDREGSRSTLTLDELDPGQLLAVDSAELFPGLSGYSLTIEAPQGVLPSFLIYNLGAASGRSPAQTRAIVREDLSNTLLFGYLPASSTDSAAIVIVAPDKKIGEITTVDLTLFGPEGLILAGKTLVLNENQPMAQTLNQLFEQVPEDATVMAVANDGTRLAGTTFVFNDLREPAMALPFGGSVGLASVIPWVVNNEQWLSRIILFNKSDVSTIVELTAISRDGRRLQKSLELGAQANFAETSDRLFPELSGYSLLIRSSSREIYASFLTFNLMAVSGRSPAQTTGLGLEALTDRLVFGYLPSTQGGVAALALVTPEAAETEMSQVQLLLYGPEGGILEEAQVSLVGNRPLVGVLGDFFNGPIPLDAGVVARSLSGRKLAGISFAFNSEREPAMSTPFSKIPLSP